MSEVDFGDYQYLVDDLLKVMADRELIALEIAHRMHMGMDEVWNWLLTLEKERIVRRRKGGDGHYWWRRVNLP